MMPSIDIPPGTHIKTAIEWAKWVAERTGQPCGFMFYGILIQVEPCDDLETKYQEYRTKLSESINSVS